MNERRPTVVAGYDGSVDSSTALAWATSYADRAGGTLRLVSAWDWPTYQGAPVVYGDYDPEHTVRDQLKAAAGRCGLPADRVDLVVSRGSPPRVLLHQAESADLLVVGSRGLGSFSRLLLGSVSSACVHHAHCPVVVVRETAEITPTARVVVGVDGSPMSLSALRWAMDYAGMVGCGLTAVSVLPPIPYGTARPQPPDDDDTEVESWLVDLVEKEQVLRRRRLTPEPRIVVTEGSPSHMMVEFSEGARLVVVGGSSNTGLHRVLLGSVSSALTRHAESSVVVVHEHADDTMSRDASHGGAADDAETGWT
jgi:nucleotide-binding universal stress UspA family protein